MKKILAFAVALTLILSLSVPAFAMEARYDATREFLADLEEVEGFTGEVDSIVVNPSGDKYEMVVVTYSGGEYSQYVSSFILLFAEDASKVLLRMPRLLYFDESKLYDVMRSVNTINANSTGAKLYVDESDFSVAAELYLLTTPESSTDIVGRGLGHMLGFTDTVYEDLAAFAIA